jgi:hypothetical protein
MRWVFENLTQDEMRSNFEAQFDILVAGIEGLNGTG